MSHLEETKIYVLDEAGGRVWRGKCASHPDELETTICKHAPRAVRIGLETGPLTTWLWTELDLLHNRHATLSSML